MASNARAAGGPRALTSCGAAAFVKGRAIADVKASEVRAFASSIEGTAKHVRNLMTPLRQTFADAAGIRDVDLNDEAIAAFIARRSLVYGTYGKFIPQDCQKPKAQAGLRAVGS